MKAKLVWLLVALQVLALAQTDRAMALAELERDIWRPFVEGVNTDNPDLYNRMKADDFQWVSDRASVRIMNKAEYIEDALKVMAARRERGQRGEVEIRFVERFVNGDFAVEKCVVKYTQFEPSKEPTQSYGRMTVFARREGGVWKKVVQYPQSTPASADDFARAEPMGALAAKP